MGVSWDAITSNFFAECIPGKLQEKINKITEYSAKTKGLWSNK